MRLESRKRDQGGSGTGSARRPASQGEIHIDRLTKVFDTATDKVYAIRDVDLQIGDGEFVCLLGPSGCGKTTTLRCIAGLEHPNSGRIRLGDRTVYDHSRSTVVPAEERGLGMVFQSYAIWPHMTVFDNVAYPLRKGLRRRRYSEKEIAGKVSSVLEAVDCAVLADRYPGELSGGQQQRVALARAIVYEPNIMLFDEPLSNLDAKLRERMRFELRELQARIGFTAVYVTHDQGEALALGDRIAVMAEGRVRQLGTPEEVYDRPVDGFVADFIGTANVLGVEQFEDDGAVIVTGFGKFRAEPERADSARDLRAHDYQVVFRPENVRIVPPSEASQPNVFSVTIASRAFTGDGHIYSLGNDTDLRIVDHDRNRKLDVGDRVDIHVPPGNVRVVPSGGFVPGTTRRRDEAAAE